MTLADIRQTVADEITATCAPWRAYTYVPDQINPPVCIVDYRIGPQLDFADRAEAARDWTIVVDALAQRDDSRSSQLLLDTLRDPTNDASLAAAIEDSAAFDFILSIDANEIQPISIGASAPVEYLMVKFELKAVR